MLKRNYPSSRSKLTPLSETPEEWEVVRLGDQRVSKNVDSGQTAPQGKEYFENGTLPFVRIKHLNNLLAGKYIADYELINEKAIAKCKLRLFPKGSIIFAKSGESIRLERKAILEKNSYVVNHFCVIAPNLEETDRDYLFYSLSKIKFSNLIAQTTTPSINLSEIEKVKLPFPPLPEQHKIAEILSTADEAIQKTDEIIAKTQELKKGLMQQLLTKGIGHKKFKKTEIGEIPEEWEVVRLGELGEIITGTTPSTKIKEYYGNEYMLITPFDLGEIKYVYSTQKKLSKKGLSISRALPKDTVLITCIGSTIGKTGMTIEKCTTNQQINSIVCNKNDPHYTYYALSHQEGYIRQIADQSPVPIINKSSFSKLKILRPPLLEQCKIAEILSSVDEKIGIEKKRREKLEELKKGLMQVLLTGRVRVKA